MLFIYVGKLTTIALAQSMAWSRLIDKPLSELVQGLC